MAARDVGVRQLARIVPCNPGHISNLRSGSARPSLELADKLDGILEAGGTLAAPAAEASPVVPGGDLGLIELARRTEASDLGSGTLELLQQSADRLCRDYPTVDTPRPTRSEVQPGRPRAIYKAGTTEGDVHLQPAGRPDINAHPAHLSACRRWSGRLPAGPVPAR